MVRLQDASEQIISDVIIANLPNLRRLFVEARTEAEESAISRKAFYNIALFMSSVAIFGLIAQRLNKP
ncbi:hypothetical protein K3495_g7910 [Podosphaera aphanis]|nr:hypothetical protein K3495_g7910 [Podosphaera aphanis]